MRIALCPLPFARSRAFLRFHRSSSSLNRLHPTPQINIDLLCCAVLRSYAFFFLLLAYTHIVCCSSCCRCFFDCSLPALLALFCCCPRPSLCSCPPARCTFSLLFLPFEPIATFCGPPIPPPLHHANPGERGSASLGAMAPTRVSHTHARTIPHHNTHIPGAAG